MSCALKHYALFGLVFIKGTTCSLVEVETNDDGNERRDCCIRAFNGFKHTFIFYMLETLAVCSGMHSTYWQSTYFVLCIISLGYKFYAP